MNALFEPLEYYNEISFAVIKLLNCDYLPFKLVESVLNVSTSVLQTNCQYELFVAMIEKCLKVVEPDEPLELRTTVSNCVNSLVDVLFSCNTFDLDLVAKFCILVDAIVSDCDSSIRDVGVLIISKITNQISPSHRTSRIEFIKHATLNILTSNIIWIDYHLNILIGSDSPRMVIERLRAQELFELEDMNSY